MAKGLFRHFPLSVIIKGFLVFSLRPIRRKKGTHFINGFRGSNDIDLAYHPTIWWHTQTHTRALPMIPLIIPIQRVAINVCINVSPCVFWIVWWIFWKKGFSEAVSDKGEYLSCYWWNHCGNNEHRRYHHDKPFFSGALLFSLLLRLTMLETREVGNFKIL